MPDAGSARARSRPRWVAGTCSRCGFHSFPDCCQNYFTRRQERDHVCRELGTAWLRVKICSCPPNNDRTELNALAIEKGDQPHGLLPINAIQTRLGRARWPKYGVPTSTPLSIKSLPAINRAKSLSGRLPSACRGAFARLASRLRKSAELAVTGRVELLFGWIVSADKLTLLPTESKPTLFFRT